MARKLSLLPSTSNCVEEVTAIRQSSQQQSRVARLIITIRSLTTSSKILASLAVNPLFGVTNAISLDEIAELKPTHICISPGTRKTGRSRNKRRKSCVGSRRACLCLVFAWVTSASRKFFGGQVVHAER